ncbi:Fatty acid desaturase 4 protein [Thalictrum thalictroides]|uniref:Fatty acid desaturase 4 protein n=1 Tax=Thalictrum thalictroides TaxID=46969 RepID=A0A7J6VB23_THATH|nr:Fatty acid desaturase 4 protein [Thalictrum thalictroides]
MYTLPQNRLSIKNPHYLHSCQPRIVTHFSCAVTTTTNRPETNRVVLEEAQLINKSRDPLLNSGRSLISDDPSLQSTWTHRAWVASGCTSVFVCLAKSTVNSIDANLFLEPILAGLLGYLLADLGSGVYHWGIDNYGDGSTAVFGSQIEAFQGHHKWPWTITRRQFANNLHALARVITFVVVPIDIAINDPVLLSFAAMCSGCIMFSQQFHAWAHGTKSKLPPVVVALQESGVLVSRSQHSAHHRQPYNNNYCIVSGAWNKILDENMVFEALELVFFFKFGVKPRSWAEPNSDWTEETEANLQQNM